MFLQKPSFGDELLLQSIDWLGNFPWRQDDTIRTEKDKYQFLVNVKGFEPKEITVKIVDGYVVVEARHEERREGEGYVSRHFKRKYALPEECIAEKMESKMSSDGVLTIIAPRKESVVKKDTVIPVTHEDKVKSKL